jgi:hypothetical protein
METAPVITKRKHPVRKVLLWILAALFLILSIAGIYIYRNFNQLLSDALIKNFNSSLISDVYELRFEKLRVNPLMGNISVFNVVLQPRQKPLHTYPYINSSFRLHTRMILLADVQILDLVRLNVLKLDRIEISEPEIELSIENHLPIFFPFKDTTSVDSGLKNEGKSPIDSYSLKQFELLNASIHITNAAKERELNVRKFYISVRDLFIKQLPGKDMISYNHIDISIGDFAGRMKHETLKYLGFKNFTLTLDTLDIQKSVDTLIYHFADFSTGLKLMDIQTTDSTFHIALNSLLLSYKDKSIQLNGFSFKPNISNARLQAKSRFQKAGVSGSFGTLLIAGLDFDSLLYHRKLFIDDISIDTVQLSLYKDKSKPLDKNKFPQYLGQKIAAIPIPLHVTHLKATSVSLVNLERKEDGNTAKVTIQRGTLEAKNITNLPSKGDLTVYAAAYIENKAYLELNVAYSYLKPQFSISLKAAKFNISDLNQIIEAYTPAKINKGIVDEISLSGTVFRTNATGTMKFLYHNLEVDMKMSNKKWQNNVLAFAANTYLNSSNPPSADKPPRIVTYHAERDMNKGGFNIILRSFLQGLKETMIMSKENKKAYKETKKDLKHKNQPKNF